MAPPPDALPAPKLTQPKQKKQRSKESSGGSSAPSLECSVCGRCFSRPSHHDRHYRTHLPPEGRLSLPCDRCSKSFGRKDVLLRHLRTAHGVDPGPQPKAAQKSCYRCVQLRRKCDRAQPCHLCAAGGAVCQYPAQLTADNTPGPEIKNSPDSDMALHSHTQAPQVQPLQQQPLHAQNFDSGSSMMMGGYTTPESAGSHSQNQTPPVTIPDDASGQHQLFHNGPSGAYPGHAPPQSIHPQRQPHQQLHQHIHPHDRPHPGYDTAMAVDALSIPGAVSQPPVDQAHDAYLSSNAASHGLTSVASASVHSMQSASGVSPAFSDEYYVAQDTSSFASSLSAAGQLDFRGTGLDWLALEVPELELYHSTEGVGLSDMEPTMANQTALHVPQQQHTPLPAPPPPPLSQLLSQSHPQYPLPFTPQPSQQQLERPSSSHYLPYPGATVQPHGLPSNSHNTPSGTQTPHAPYSNSPPLSQAPPPPPAHPTQPHAKQHAKQHAQQHAQQHAHTSSGQQHPPNAANPVLPWPFEDGPQHDQQPQRYSLPSLREVLQNNLLLSSNPAPNDKSVLENLVVLMSDTRITSASDSDDARSSGTPGPSSRKAPGNNVDDASSATPSLPLSVPSDPGMAHASTLLKNLMDTYITKFHPILPLVHVPTWNLETAPRVLVSAMACVGSLLADDERSSSLTLSISDICMPMIAWMGSSDSANYRDISYLSALCVHQIYSLGSGNRHLYQNADRSRGILVGGLRGMGCLTTRLSLEDQADQVAHQYQNNSSGTAPPTPTTGNPSSASTSISTSTSLHDQWMAWMYREREKRTAWSSFEYDCSLCTLTGRRGAVDLSELPSRLPCAETLWDASSATAWAALRTRLHPDAQGALVSLVIRGALRDDSTDSSSDSGSIPSLQSSASTPNPYSKIPGVSFWGKRLCAQVIGRLLWDLKQLETLATNEYFGMPSLSTAQAMNKVRLLRALDNLLVSMDQPTTVADLISYNIASLIGHYSHLYTAQDVLDIILYIVRNTVAHGVNRRHHTGIQMAKRRLVATLSRDPQEARRLVYHAAQIVAVANDYLVSAPCEILRLFMGYTFLIAFAAYCPSGNRFQLPETGASGPSAIQLDVPSHRIASTADVDNWIAHGGPASIGTVANLYADGGSLAINRDAQVLLQRLKCWGLAEKFTKILQNFESTTLAELNG